MAYKITWPRRASLDLTEIQDYIAAKRSDAAIREARNILQQVDQLAQFPLIGALYRSTGRRDYRSVLSGNYRVIYHVDSSEMKVHIASIRHGAINEPDLA